MSRVRNVLLILFGYIFLFLVINPLEFPGFIIGDEWSSFRQLEAFESGVIRLNGQKDTAFILQGVLGFILNVLFNDAFITVRVLNFLVTLFFGVGLYLLLESLTKKPKSALVLSAIVFANPLFMFLSFTFYSEVYFLAFMVWALYFLNLYYSEREKNKWFLFLGAVFSSSLVLIRQQGIVIPLIFCSISFMKSRKVRFDNVVLTSMAFLFLLVYGLWPVYISWDKEYLFSGFAKLLNVTSSKRDYSVYLSYLYVFPYFGFFLFPVLKKKITKLWIIFPAIVISVVVYRAGVFPIGNVLSLGGIYTKSNDLKLDSIFEIPSFKYLLSILSGIGCVSLVFQLMKFSGSKLKSNITRISLVVAFVLMLVSNFAISDVYDRYLLIPFVLLVLVLAKELEIKLNFFNVASFLVLFLFSFVLTFEYITEKKISYSLALNSDLVDRLSSIKVDDEYGKYFKSVESNDYTGLIYVHPEVETRCVVYRSYHFEKNSIFAIVPGNLEVDIYGQIDPKFNQEYGSRSFIEPTKYFRGYSSAFNLSCVE